MAHVGKRFTDRTQYFVLIWLMGCAVTIVAFILWLGDYFPSYIEVTPELVISITIWTFVFNKFGHRLIMPIAQLNEETNKQI